MILNHTHTTHSLWPFSSACLPLEAETLRLERRSLYNDLTSIFKHINLFVFEGAIRPFTRSYFFGLTQKVTKKVKASSSPFLLVQEFFSFAVLRPVRRSPYLSLRRSFRSFRPGSPHPAALQESAQTCGREFAMCDSSSEKSLQTLTLEDFAA